MSLPRELLDDLLSRYMDGQLSDDESRRVEDLLASDDEVIQHWQRLQQQQALVREALAESVSPRSGFSSRVMQAALDAAEQEGLAAEHPLRRAARAPAQTSPSWRRSPVVWGTLATAAAVAGALLAFPRDNQVPTITADRPDNVGVIADVDASDSSQLADGSTGQPSGLPSDSVASTAADRSGNPDGLGDASADSGASPTANKSTLADAGDAATSDATDSLPREDRMVANQATGDASPDELGNDAIGQGMAELQMIFVYELHVTQRGQENNVVQRVFGDAGIAQTERRDVNEQLVGYLRQGNLIAADSGDPESASANVIFLEGSGLKMDDLMLRFLETRGEISRVGFRMVMDPPVVTAVENLSRPISPEKIRQPDALASGLVAQQLVSDASRSSDAGRFAPGSLQFMELQADTAAAMQQLRSPASTGNGEGDDLVAQVLLILRYE